MEEREGVGRGVTYDLNPERTALVGVDFQIGFGDAGWERVPYADAAVANFKRVAAGWRAAGGTVIFVHTTYTPEIGPTGNMTDFAPDISVGLAEGSVGATLYDGLVEDGDLLVRKTSFSAVASSDLVSVIRDKGLDSAAVGGLTTPICVQTTVDGLSMTGIKVAVIEDACASQAIGRFSATDAHDLAIQRMGYIFAQVTQADALLSLVKARAMV